MKNLAKSAALVGALLSSSVMANGSVEGTVTKIAIDRVYNPPRAFIVVDGAKTGSPACHVSSTWSFVLPLQSDVDRDIYSMLLSAHATRRPLKLQGRGLCDIHTSVETMSYIEY